MVRTDLEAIVGNLGAFYERKARPSAMTLELWMQKVKNIPTEAVPWIQDRIMDESEMWPRNFPQTLWAMYNAWIQANPDKRAYRESVDCPDCEGGWLSLQKELKAYRQPISHSAPCGRCRQIPAAKYMTLHEAISKGFRRIDLTTYPQHGNRNLKAMLDSIGRKMDKPRAYCD